MEVRVLFIPRSVLIFPVNESERDKERERKFHLQLNHTWWWCCNQEESRFAMKRINRGCSKYSGINITSPSAPPVPPLDLTKVKVNEFIILAQNCIQSGDSSTPYPSRCHEEYLTILRHESLAFSMPRQLELENAMHCHTTLTLVSFRRNFYLHTSTQVAIKFHAILRVCVDPC